VATAVEAAVVAPVADGVELSTESLRCNAAEDEFNNEVTSIVTVPGGRFDDLGLASRPSDAALGSNPTGEAVSGDCKRGSDEKWPHVLCFNGP
jgi:hypothetical protein